MWLGVSLFSFACRACGDEGGRDGGGEWVGPLEEEKEDKDDQGKGDEQ